MEPTQDEYATRNLFRGTRKVDDNEAGNVSLRAISAGLRKIKDYVSLSLSLSLLVVLFFILLQLRKHDRSVFIIEDLHAVINNWYVERWWSLNTSRNVNNKNVSPLAQRRYIKSGLCTDARTQE